MELTKNDTKVIKGFAILLMVLLHLFSHLDNISYTPLMKIGGTPLIYFVALYGTCCVSVYCFCSGYAQYLLAEKQGKGYFKGRVKSLLALLINYEIILVIFCFIGLITKSTDIPISLGKFIKSVFLLGNYNSAWWFLIVYIMLTLTSPILFRIVKHCNSFVVLAVTLLLYAVSYYFRAINPVGNFIKNPILMRGASYIVLYFSSLVLYVVGMIFYKHKVITFIRRKLKYGENKLWIPIFVVVFCIMVAVQAFIRSLPFAPLFGLITVICLSLLKRSDKVEACMLFLGTHSTNIWLMHMFFYKTLFVDFIYIAKYPLLIVLFMLVICILISFPINYFIKFINKTILSKN